MIATERLHHSPEHWEKPDLFRPERFDPDSQEHQGRNRFAFLPLGYGRECAGKALVSEQMKTAIATLLHDFEFRLDQDKMKESANKLYSETGLAKYPVHGVHLTVHPLR